MPDSASRGGSPDGRRERWRAHREGRRTDLIAAVVAAVEQRGAALGMDDIAEASGVAKPVFYRYFADKADLHRAVGHSIAQAVVGSITQAIDVADSPREQLLAGIDAYLAAIEARPELYRFVVRPDTAPAASDAVEDFASVVGLHVSRVIGDIRRAAGLDTGCAEAWGFGLVGMVRAAADRWLENPTMTRAALAGYLTDLVWPGLRVDLPADVASPPPRRLSRAASG